MNVNQSEKTETYRKRTPLSPYAAFFSIFQGYEFLDLHTSKVYSKMQMWYRDREFAERLANEMLAKGKLLNTRFQLIDYNRRKFN